MKDRGGGQATYREKEEAARCCSLSRYSMQRLIDPQSWQDVDSAECRHIDSSLLPGNSSSSRIISAGKTLSQKDSTSMCRPPLQLLHTLSPVRLHIPARAWLTTRGHSSCTGCVPHLLLLLPMLCLRCAAVFESIVVPLLCTACGVSSTIKLASI